MVETTKFMDHGVVSFHTNTDVDRNTVLIACATTDSQHVIVTTEKRGNEFVIVSIVDQGGTARKAGDALVATLLRCAEHTYNIEVVKAQVA
jgi:hypothetical protein